MIIVVFALLIASVPTWFYFTAIRPMKMRLHEVMYQTDARQVQEGLHDLWLHHKPRIPPGEMDIEVTQSPMSMTLMALDPHWTNVSPGQVRFELGGAECHYGFEFVEDAAAITKSDTSFRTLFPSKEIRPGLWFYAEWGLPSR